MPFKAPMLGTERRTLNVTHISTAAAQSEQPEEEEDFVCYTVGYRGLGTSDPLPGELSCIQ